MWETYWRQLLRWVGRQLQGWQSRRLKLVPNLQQVLREVPQGEAACPEGEGQGQEGEEGVERQATLMVPQEPHLMLKNNAMFLLDLASASCFTQPAQSLKKQTPNRGDLFLPSVSKEYRLDLNPFPSVPFQYFIRQTAQSSDSAFADYFLIDAEERVFVRSRSLSIHKSTSYRPRLPMEPRHSPLAS